MRVNPSVAAPGGSMVPKEGKDRGSQIEFPVPLCQLVTLCKDSPPPFVLKSVKQGENCSFSWAWRLSASRGGMRGPVSSVINLL